MHPEGCGGRGRRNQPAENAVEGSGRIQKIADRADDRQDENHFVCLLDEREETDQNENRGADQNGGLKPDGQSGEKVDSLRDIWPDERFDGFDDACG
mgnify:CR=1 FL=1